MRMRKRWLLLLIMLCESTILQVYSSTPITHEVFTVINTQAGLTDNQVQYILQLEDGRMGITTVGNFNIYDGSSFSYVHYTDDKEIALPNYTGAYHVYSEGERVWIKDYKVLRCFQLSSNNYLSDITSYLQKRTGVDEAIYDFFIDSQRTFWAVTQKGIWNEATKSYLQSQATGLIAQDIESENDTTYVFYHDGSMEAFLRESGKSLYRTSAYDATESYSLTSLVKKLSNGSFVQARTENGRSILLYFNTAKREWKTLMRVPYILHTIAVNGNDDCYVTSEKGIWAVRPEEGQCQFLPTIQTQQGPMSSAGMNTIFIDAQNGIWLGTYREGLLYAHSSRFLFSQLPSLGALGLNEETLKSSKEVRLPYPLKVKHNDFCQDKEGRLWIATNDGLRCYTDAQHFTTYYTEDGLSNNLVKAVVEDTKGQIWASTAAGLTSLLPSACKDSVTIQRYGSIDGIQPAEYLAGRGYLLPDGHILFQSITGWTLFHPDSVGYSYPLLSPQFSRVIVNGVNALPRVQPGTHPVLQLAYNENNISIDVAPLIYAHPENRFIKIRITSDKKRTADWQRYPVHENGNGGCSLVQLVFTQVPPGEYCLEVAPDLDDNLLSHASSFNQLTIRIKHPWWNTPLARAAFGLIACLVIFWIIRARHRITERNHREEMLLMRIQCLMQQCDMFAEEQALRKQEDASTEEEEVRGNEQNDEASSKSLTAEEREFISRAASLVEENLGKDYSVERLSKDLCMDRTGLYKKMTFLLDQSPSVFIRSIRLNRAATLLQTTDMTVIEVAEATGFSSASHLSRFFTAEFGVTPVKYKKRNN